MTTSDSSLITRLKRFLLLVSLFASVGTVEAKNLPDQNSGCQLVVPDTWSVSNPAASGAYAVQAVNGDHTKSVLLYVEPVSSTASIGVNSALIQGLEHGAQTSGAKIVSRDHRKLSGNTFYVLTCTQDSGKNVLQSTTWVTVASGHMYQICLYDLNADPDKDAELTAALNSFSFPAK
jgi:hypothetical protein